MLSPRLTNCVECSSISALLSNIDCKLFELSDELYNNTVFILNRPFSGTVMSDLLNYKRILTYKFCNEDYAKNFTVDQIASKVRLLTGSSKSCCSQCDKPRSQSSTITTTSTIFPTTTTTSTANPTTTTTSTITPTTTTTTTFNINNPMSFYYGIPICLGYPTLSCSISCNTYTPLECVTFYVSPLCSINLSAGCILYVDDTYTTQATSANGIYSNGQSCYNVVNGVITSVSTCPSPTTTTTTTAHITNCSGIVSVRPPVNVNGNAITSTYTGSGIYAQGLGSGWLICSGAHAIGDNFWLGYDYGQPFTYTINFSNPVNNIAIMIAVLGVPCDETYTFTTSSGNPTITANYSCFATISGNQITGGLGSVFGPIDGGGGEFVITAPSPYTSITISGIGQCAGSLFGIVCSSI